MDVISCNSCGVILDRSKLKFPTMREIEESGWSDENSAWNGYEHTPVTQCPVCKHQIPKEGEIRK